MVRENDIDNLKNQVEEAKREAALKTSFLSTMSHDLRTPLNGIIGMLELANHYPDDREMQRKCHEKVLESAKHLVSLLNDVLDLNKLESGENPEQELDFDLTKILSNSNNAMQIQATDKGIEYVVDWNKGDLRTTCLRGNPIYLEKLLKTVCDNAIKFTNPGGKVSVWCVDKPIDDSHVMLEFGCQDTGIGMSEEFQQKAFEAFTQENESSRSKYEGTGLGLAIARKIVDHLGGTIQIQSAKGTGTTVMMCIPFKIGEEHKITRHTHTGPIQLAGMRALIAEDNDINAEIAEKMLENHGIIVEWAQDGAQVADKFERSDLGYYDIILMDIMMPNMNGWDAARKIRSMKRYDAERIPIIAMSANAFAEDIINSRVSGMDEHLAKPLDEARIINAINECIQLRALMNSL